MMFFFARSGPAYDKGFANGLEEGKKRGEAAAWARVDRHVRTMKGDRRDALESMAKMQKGLDRVAPQKRAHRAEITRLLAKVKKLERDMEELVETLSA
jgi:flagellar biosynthesis/type III secretory pathway protein FliH